MVHKISTYLEPGILEGGGEGGGGRYGGRTAFDGIRFNQITFYTLGAHCLQYCHVPPQVCSVRLGLTSFGSKQRVPASEKDIADEWLRKE